MTEIITKLIVNFVSLVAVTALFPGIHFDSVGTILIAAAVLWLVNIVLKPVIIILTLPINILSLGLFTFVINTAMFYLVSAVVPGFRVDGFTWALFGSIVFGIINFILNLAFVPKKRGKWAFRCYRGRGETRDIIDAEIIEEKKQLKD